MTRECKDIVVEHAIMHRLDSNAQGRRLVRKELTLNDAALELIRPLVIAAIDCTDIFAVDRAGASIALSACWHMLVTPSAFVLQSTELAKMLNGLMEENHRISKGDLLVAIARDSAGPFVALLKLEKILQFEPDYVAPGADGTWELSIRRNDNAVSPETKPQKCAVIREPIADRGYHVQLHDEQINKRRDIAQFFYRDFLGCELLPTPAQRTLAFCNEAEAWRRKYAPQLNRQGIVSFTRAFQQHLNAESVDFEAFAADALKGSNNQELSKPGLASLLQAKVFPDIEEARPPFFEPDRDTATKLLSAMNFTLGGGIKLSGPTDQLLGVIDNTDTDGDGRLRLLLKTAAMERIFRG